MSNKTFAIAEPSKGPFGVLILLGALILPTLGFVAMTGMTKRSLTVDASGVTLSTPVYGGTVAKGDLKVAEAKALDLEKDTPYALKVRTNGIGLPGLMEGWFTLNNDEKVLASITDPTHVVYIPTTKGHAIMASVADPAAVLDALKK